MWRMFGCHVTSIMLPVFHMRVLCLICDRCYCYVMPGHVSPLYLVLKVRPAFDIHSNEQSMLVNWYSPLLLYLSDVFVFYFCFGTFCILFHVWNGALCCVLELFKDFPKCFLCMRR
jgi:hypothetical protein